MKLSDNVREKISNLPDKPGVYMMRDRLGRVIYVGKAKDLKKRVSTYFHPAKKRQLRTVQPKIAAMVSLVYDIDVQEVKSEAEALILEGRLIKQFKPRYNTDSKDDKRFLMVRVDIHHEIPQFRLTRNRTDSKSRYYGPFVNSTMLKKTLQELRTEFGVLLGDARPKKIGPGKYKLYDDVRAEIYGHPNEVTVEEYEKRVENACKFMAGKAQKWLQEVEERMISASKEKKYEKAAQLRDLLFSIRETLLPRRKFFRDASTAKRHDALEVLRLKLGPENTPRRMECFDISHISGTFVVASMVCFINGVPDKAQYRRYKIKSFIGNDDYRAMEEVVARRYKRLHKEGRDFPDLILIDGGRGQVNVALKSFLVLGLDPPMIIGLAKKRETIVFADDRHDLNLPLSSPALQLLQRLRDEAHRFANAFNAELRSKRLQESVLDDFQGLGPIRKQVLLEHFRSIDRLRKASLAQLREVPGIGPKMAVQLQDFLKTS